MAIMRNNGNLKPVKVRMHIADDESITMSPDIFIYSTKEAVYTSALLQVTVTNYGNELTSV